MMQYKYIFNRERERFSVLLTVHISQIMLHRAVQVTSVTVKQNNSLVYTIDKTASN